MPNEIQDQQQEPRSPESDLHSNPTEGRRRKPVTSSDSQPSPRSEQTVPAIHLVLQAKGGCGKTVVASLLSQAMKEDGRCVTCLDTDSMNGSFSAIPAMHAERVELLDGENELNVEAMNACVSRLLELDGTTVIDSGASSFVPLTVYLHNTGLFDVLLAKGKRIVVHVPIVGGEAMEETVQGLVSMVSQFPASVEFVVWKNEFFGPLVVDDLKLEETVLFDECRPRIASIVTLHALKPRFEGATFRKMLSHKMTFDEALADASPFDLISRLWLEGVWSTIKPQIVMAVA